MTLFNEFLPDVIKLAVGLDSEGWYVQTTDVKEDTYYSESIESGLNTKIEALAIANHYSRKYNLEVEIWDNDVNEPVKERVKNRRVNVIRYVGIGEYYAFFISRTTSFSGHTKFTVSYPNISFDESDVLKVEELITKYRLTMYTEHFNSLDEAISFASGGMLGVNDIKKINTKEAVVQIDSSKGIDSIVFV